MYLDVLNSDSSKTGIETEANLIRAALLMSDKIAVAGMCSFFLYLKEFINKKSLDEKKKFLKNTVKRLYEKDPRIIDIFNDSVDLYLTLMKQKSKSIDATLAMMKLKPYIDKVQNDIIYFFDGVACVHKITDLQQFALYQRKNITIIVKDDTLTKPNIFITKTILKETDDILIFDSTVFGAAEHKELSNHDNGFAELFQNTSDPVFLFSEMLKMNVLRNPDYEHLKTLRQINISGTEPFRKALVHASEALRNTLFSEENMPSIRGLCDNVRCRAADFEKIERGNTLLETLLKAGTESKRLKISIAVTSFSNMIRMLERLEIINERERMYSSWELLNNINLSASMPFLIAEEE